MTCLRLCAFHGLAANHTLPIFLVAARPTRPPRESTPVNVVSGGRLSRLSPAPLVGTAHTGAANVRAPRGPRRGHRAPMVTVIASPHRSTQRANCPADRMVCSLLSGMFGRLFHNGRNHQTANVRISAHMSSNMSEDPRPECSRKFQAALPHVREHDCCMPNCGKINQCTLLELCASSLRKGMRIFSLLFVLFSSANAPATELGCGGICGPRRTTLELWRATAGEKVSKRHGGASQRMTQHASGAPPWNPICSIQSMFKLWHSIYAQATSPPDTASADRIMLQICSTTSPDP